MLLYSSSWWIIIWENTLKYSLYQTLGRQRPVIVDEQILVVAFTVLVIGSEHFLADGDDFRPTLVNFHSPTTWWWSKWIVYNFCSNWEKIGYYYNVAITRIGLHIQQYLLALLATYIRRRTSNAVGGLAWDGRFCCWPATRPRHLVHE